MERNYIYLDFYDFAEKIYEDNPDYVLKYTGDCHGIFRNFCVKLRKPYFKFLFFYRRKTVFEVSWENTIFLLIIEHETEAIRLSNLYKNYNQKADVKVIYFENKPINHES